MKQSVIVCIFLFTLSMVLAQNPGYTTSGDSLRFEEPTSFSNKQVREEKNESTEMFPYMAGIRFGAGYCISFLEFDFDRIGYENGIESEVLGSDNDQGFTWPAPAFNFEVKLGLPGPLKYFAVGVAFDYNILPIDGMTFESQGLLYRKTTQDDVTDLHILSIVAFLEFRYPFQTGNTWVAPYLKFGLGASFQFHDNRDLIRVNTTAFTFMAAVGVEYYLNREISIFFEPRWHYAEPGMRFHPYNNTTKFKGDLDLSHLSIMIGVNFYLGVGKSL